MMGITQSCVVSNIAASQTIILLVAMHTGTGPLKPLQAEPEQWARFNHYIASIAATDEWILATSPPGIAMGSGQKPRANWWN